VLVGGQQILYMILQNLRTGVRGGQLLVSNPLIGLLGESVRCWAARHSSLPGHGGSPQPWAQQCLEIGESPVPPSVWCWPPLMAARSLACVIRGNNSTPPSCTARESRRELIGGEATSRISYFSLLRNDMFWLNVTWALGRGAP